MVGTVDSGTVLTAGLGQRIPDPGKLCPSWQLLSDYSINKDSHEDITSKGMTWSGLYYYHSDNYMKIGFKRE